MQRQLLNIQKRGGKGELFSLLPGENIEMIKRRREFSMAFISGNFQGKQLGTGFRKEKLT